MSQKQQRQQQQQQGQQQQRQQQQQHKQQQKDTIIKTARPITDTTQAKTSLTSAILKSYYDSSSNKKK